MQILSKWVAMVLVRVATRAWVRAFSRSSRIARSAQRACASRSGQPWHGWCFTSSRSRAILALASLSTAPGR